MAKEIETDTLDGCSTKELGERFKHLFRPAPLEEFTDSDYDFFGDERPMSPEEIAVFNSLTQACIPDKSGYDA